MNKTCAVLCCAFFMTFSTMAAAENIKIGGSDALVSALEAEEGKRVSLKLASGAELTGTVRAVNQNIVQLSALAGKEYYDAIINIDYIEAIVIRVK